MSTYVNLPGGPESAVRIGLKLQGLANDLATQTAPILANIHRAEHQAPWGDDDCGHGLYQRYTQDTASGPFNESLHGQLRQSGQPLGQVAQFVLDTIGNIENSDLDSSRDIEAL